jgi:hypothetical protein
MRQKVSTVLESALFREVKMESARTGKQISEVVREALELYLRTKGRGIGTGNVVGESWGALPMDREDVKRLLEDEESLLDA